MEWNKKSLQLKREKNSRVIWVDALGEYVAANMCSHNPSSYFQRDKLDGYGATIFGLSQIFPFN